ncbi:hypothetical protein E4U59_007330 [Claviceps monticola]|nr:hypothetical protein E4U59_007330 [Claviceps monticola]
MGRLGTLGVGLIRTTGSAKAGGIQQIIHLESFGLQGGPSTTLFQLNAFDLFPYGLEGVGRAVVPRRGARFGETSRTGASQHFKRLVSERMMGIGASNP